MAYDIAKAQDDLSTTKTGFFAGLPFPLKMLGQDHAGLPSTASAKLFKDNIAQADDNYVKGLLTSGLTPFGQTNAPEFGFKIFLTQPSMVIHVMSGTLLIILVGLLVALHQLLLQVSFPWQGLQMVAAPSEFQPLSLV